jgi:hypothetical protein
VEPDLDPEEIYADLLHDYLGGEIRCPSTASTGTGRGSTTVSWCGWKDSLLEGKG